MKKILIDTHVLIWWLNNPNKLKQHHLDVISNPENIIYVSIASFFEITLKIKIGKLEFREDFEEVLRDNSFDSLPITFNHLQILKNLGIDHKDPFDILLVSQAISDGLEFLTYDTVLQESAKGVKWVN